MPFHLARCRELETCRMGNYYVLHSFEIFSDIFIDLIAYSLGVIVSAGDAVGRCVYFLIMASEVHLPSSCL